MKKDFAKRWLIVFAIVLVMLFVAFMFFLETINPNDYRDQIAEALSRQTGRAVNLSGPIGVTLSWHGVTIDTQNVALGNPSWSHHPAMAEIGRLSLGLSSWALLARKVVIRRVDIADADMELETNQNGECNWELTPIEPRNATVISAYQPKENPVSVYVEHVTVHDSQIVTRTQNGRENVLDIHAMSLSSNDAVLHFDGAYNDAPLTVDLSTGAGNLLSARGIWPFHITIMSGKYKFTSRGSASIDEQQVKINAYEFVAGHSDLYGKLFVDWRDVRPMVSGTVTGEKISLSDFGTQTEIEKKIEQETARASKHLFSTTPVNLDFLNTANANLDVKVDRLSFPRGDMDAVVGRLILENGMLSFAPFTAVFDDSIIRGQMQVNAAAARPQVALNLTAPAIKLEDLLLFLGAPSFLSGKADLTVNLAGTGNSVHELAESAVGVINLTSSGGKVSGHEARSIAEELMDLFAPSGSSALNCLAVRFIIKNGIAKDNGILVDTGATTVMGNGEFDLGRETLNLILHANVKEMDVGNLVPPLRIDGTFMDPNFTIDPSETARNVAGVFSGGSLNSGAPNIGQQENNACLFALDHPSGATSTRSVLPDSLMGRLRNGLDNMSDVIRHFTGN